MTAVLEAQQMSTGYASQPLVHDFDVSVEPGQIVCLLGPNGAGKTTTMLALCGVLPVMAGAVRIQGLEVKDALHKRARRGLAYVSEERSVFRGLTTRDNLRVGRADEAEAIELFPALQMRLNLPAGMLSGGEQQMLTLARALSRHPKLLLADELSLGLAPLIVDRLLQAVRDAAYSRGLGVLMVEQHARKAMMYADRVLVMRRGRVVLDMAGAEARSRIDDVEHAYLAETSATAAGDTLPDSPSRVRSGQQSQTKGDVVELETRDDGRKVWPFDHHSPEYASIYPEIYKEMRKAGAIVWSDAYDGFWIATDYEHVRKVLMDPDTFSVEPFDNMRKGGIHIPTPERAQRRPRFVPGEADGETHDTARAALNPHFSRRRVAEMGDVIAANVDRWLDRVLPRQEFDAVLDLASPIVAGIVNDHMGFGLDDPASFFRACFAMTGGAPTADNSEELISTFQGSWAQLGEIVRARRKEPRDDVVSALLAANGGQFTDEQVQSMALNVILGAADTTSALTAHCLVMLADRPDLCSFLRSDSDRIPAFIEESLRYFNVSMGVARTALRDVELGGVQIRAGDRVFVPLPSANLDPAKYDRPEMFDLERGAAQHVGMGVGSHFCLGAWLAKAIVAAVIGRFLARVDDYTVDTARLVRNPDKANINNFVTVPIQITTVHAADTEKGVKE